MARGHRGSLCERHPSRNASGGKMLLEGGTVTLLTLCIVCNGAYTGRREMPHWGHELQMIAIADYDSSNARRSTDAIASGADIFFPGTAMACGLEWRLAACVWNALPWFDSLLECGANPNVTVRAPPSFDTTLLGKIISGGLRMGRAPGRPGPPGQISTLACFVAGTAPTPQRTNPHARTVRRRGLLAASSSRKRSVAAVV